jgi:TonB-linked SusC/RagA family outer membrane protein
MLEQMYNFYPKKLVQLPGCTFKILLIMKLTTLILITAILQVSANASAQKVTLSEKNAPLNKIFEKISDQTGYDFLVSTENLKQAKLVTIDVQDEELKAVLDRIFAGQPLDYVIQKKIIVISKKTVSPGHISKKELDESITITGQVTDEKDAPLPGATVRLKGTNASVNADGQGLFTLNHLPVRGTLVVSFVSYQTMEISYGPDTKSPLIIHLKGEDNSLNEVQVIGYGTTIKRLNTGDVSKVAAVEISKQPVANPLLALEGRIPGLQVIQGSGVNGSGVSVQLRGQGSLSQGTDPLFIIDGVPYSPGNTPLNQLVSAAGDGTSNNYGLSPFNLINPADIESIDILKDADATAIYGSRGANGVILITTKKGKAGKTDITANVYSGLSRVTRTMAMLNSLQYLQMRREAFKNDGITADPSSAPDILLWDTTRYTDFKKLLIGNTAHTSDAELSISGGNENTQFLMGGGYHYETTVFPTTKGDARSSFHISLNHTSNDKRLSVNLTAMYSSDINNLPATDLTGYINTAPNLKLYDNGKLNWQDGGSSYLSLGLINANPLAFEYQTYTGKFDNLSSNINLTYKVIQNLSLKVSAGYNVVNSAEESLFPSTSLDPNLGLLPYSNFANQNQKSWIIEPQIEYTNTTALGKLDVLLGNTWQDNTNSGFNVGAYDYSSDLLLSSIAAASYAQTTNSFNEYRYDGLYGRINYNLKDRYILTISGRRDGSSRFGPADRFSNFGAVGAAWIFTEEDFIKKSLDFISFGKLRGSYGITGNDQIGNYKYLDTWTPGRNTYLATSTLDPSSLYNPNYSWEKNRKAEIAVDLGFIKDRILFSAAYYNDRSDNQLVNYTLTTQTGFSSVLENLNAVIQNTGWEFQFTSKNVTTPAFAWTSGINITAPENKLLAFPGLTGSSYANTYVIGQSLSTRKLYHSLGVDPATGIYLFEDVNHDGTLNNSDKVSLKNTDAKFYGGLLNSFRYKELELSLFLEFKKQSGLNYLNTLGGNVPGYSYYNQPAIVLSRWQKPGDISKVEQFTSSSGDAYTAASIYLTSSDAIISDASYIRLKNLSLSYNLPGKWLSKAKITSCRIYLQGQNLFTLTNYHGADPENQNMYFLPPLKTLTAGLQLTL